MLQSTHGPRIKTVCKMQLLSLRGVLSS